ncbi:MAG: DUF962 domain-containing protein, partial [Rhodospirillaceae bacterium]
MIAVFRDWFLEQMGMYAAYHRDRRNQLTHHVGVPLIVFAILLGLAHVPVIPTASIDVDAAAIVLGLLLVAYLLAVPVIGIFAVVI